MRSGASGYLILPALLTCLLAAPAHAVQEFGVTFHYNDYAKVLSTYVDNRGRVDYAGLKANRTELDYFVRDISGLYIDKYESWTDDERIPFWVNTYNALTLKSIIDHYPIKPNWKTRFLYPNGIRQIPGVWTEKKHSVKASLMSLDEIEHEVLRKEYSEPRIHMALVCAAKGCPPLRNEPYLPGEWNNQFKDQTRKFLADPLKFRIDRDAGVVYLSSIFQWFEEDFQKVYGDKESVSWGSEGQQAVMAFIGPYLDEKDWKELRDHTFSVEYLDYDWSLNDQAMP